MKRNNNEPELATYTLLNPDFHTLDSQTVATKKDDKNHVDSELSTKNERK